MTPLPPKKSNNNNNIFCSQILIHSVTRNVALRSWKHGFPFCIFCYLIRILPFVVCFFVLRQVSCVLGLGQLPCLETLELVGNPLTKESMARVRILSAFDERAEQVMRTVGTNFRLAYGQEDVCVCVCVCVCVSACLPVSFCVSFQLFSVYSPSLPPSLSSVSFSFLFL